jgi:hypothetical protein
LKTSPSGAPILRGDGVAAVRKKIEDAFNDVRSTKVERAEIDIAVADNIELMIADGVQLVEGFEEVEVELIELDAEQDPEVYIREADEHAAIQQQAHQREQSVGDYHRGAYHIDVPTEDSETLIEQALRSIGQGINK